MNERLSYYIHSFTHLRRDNKNGGAPHKPILLLSVIRLFEKGIYYNSEIEILPELVASFKSHWNSIVVTNHHPIFALPFYHMHSEPFWSLMPVEGYEKWVQSKSSMRSFKNLTTAIRSAKLDKELTEILITAEGRDVLKIALLEKYFPQAATGFYNDEDDLPPAIILNDSSEIYRKKILDLKSQLDENAFQEEVFVRGGIFKREIPKLYNNTCAISGLRIDATFNVSMVDACHIVPFSEAYDDTLSNGIALCPNLHRAFDRGLIAISDNYEVLLSKNFVESTNSSYNVSQFEQKRIHLPASTESYPSLENFKKHRERFGLS